MKPESQRIAIAELHLGLKPIPGEKASACGHLIMLTSDLNNTAFCPDYINDLNAIRKACLWAIDNLWNYDQVEAFADHLASRRHDCWYSVTHEAAQIIIRSTAEDWCYAFLKTSNLWNPDA